MSGELIDLHMYYIDGNNVQGQVPDLVPGSPQAERYTVRALQQFCKLTGKAVTLVFDGIGGAEMDFGRMRVKRPQPTDQNADGLIIRLVQADSHIREAVVVTSDRELTQHVTRLGAKVIPSGEFLDRLPRDQQENSEGKPRVRGTTEVDAWLKEFGVSPEIASLPVDQVYRPPTSRKKKIR